MNYQVTEEWVADGTFYQDCINVAYHTLVDLFGEPMDGDGEKTQAEWSILFDDGEVATIYDWKENKPVGFISNWHLGGSRMIAPNRVKELVANFINSKLLV